MGIALEHLPGTDGLPELRKKIRTKETAGFELLTLARGKIQGQDTNLATFRDRADDSDPGDLILVLIPHAGVRDAQETALDDAEHGGRRLISYGGVLVSNNEANIAVYRL
jgi:hypothetical protein